ncbi:AraC family transcriptional regulator [Isoptericola hypogeus]
MNPGVRRSAEPVVHWSTYLTPSPGHRGLGLVCLGAGEQWNPPAPTPERALGCYAAVLVGSGEGELLHGPRRRLVEVRGPAVLWLFPGVLHGYRPAGSGWSQAWVLFDGPAVAVYEAMGYLDPDLPVLSLGPRAGDGVAGAFARLLALCRRPDPDAGVRAVPALHDLLAHARRPSTDAAASDDHVLLGRLRDAARLPLTMPAHAARLGVSMSRLRDVTRSMSGLPPHEFVLGTRLSEAKALLTGSSLTVAAIARRVGYDDPAYFSRLFTRRTGLPPREFRRHGAVIVQDRSLPNDDPS